MGLTTHQLLGMGQEGQSGFLQAPPLVGGPSAPYTDQDQLAFGSGDLHRQGLGSTHFVDNPGSG